MTHTIRTRHLCRHVLALAAGLSLLSPIGCGGEEPFDSELASDSSALNWLPDLPPITYFPAPACTDAQRAAILAPARDGAASVRVKCSLKLRPHERVTKVLRFQGAEASGVTFDCGGGTIDGGPGTRNEGKKMVRVYSDVEPYMLNGEPLIYRGHPVPRKGWDGLYRVSRPQNVTIKNCNIVGTVRVWGLGQNGQDRYMWYSSRDATTPGHVKRARAAAPRYITFDNIKVTGDTGNKFYVAPGVTHLTLRNSEIAGSSTASGIYLDAESAHNVIENNYIHASAGRHQMAIDASSHNRVVGNRFSGLSNGGIYLYRNCGEDGVVRYSRPRFNEIGDNYFYYNRYRGSKPAVFLGARNGGKSYCGKDSDSGIPNSSASSNRDYAQYNDVHDNVIRKRSVSDMIRTGSSTDSPNQITGNRTERP